MRNNLENSEEISIDQILNRNGDSMHISEVRKLAKSEDDPPLIFGWENVDAFVNSLNQEAPADLPPFDLPAPPINTEQFKLALLNNIRDRNDKRTVPVGTSVIPCTQGQVGRVVGNAASLRFEPWFQAIAARPGTTPIARIYVPRPRSSTVDEAIAPRPPPAAQLWHTDVQAQAPVSHLAAPL
jgi:hypothetical protein